MIRQLRHEKIQPSSLLILMSVLTISGTLTLNGCTRQGQLETPVAHIHGQPDVQAPGQAQGQPQGQVKKKEKYTCSMHPAIVSDKPGSCPICHMDLQKVEDDDSTGAIQVSQSLKGRAAFALTPERQQMIGMTSEPVQKRQLSFEVKASGRVAYDPELYTAAEEYRHAMMSHSQMLDPVLRNQSQEMIASTKTKLKLLGLSPAQVQAVGSSQLDAMSLILPKGYVWIYAEVFEYEIAGLKQGLAVEVETPSAPGVKFFGKLSSISPVVNSPTRTIRVRATVPDPKSLLRPDAFVNVHVKVDLGEKLAVPETAILHSGDEAYVFVVKEGTRFEPRAVKVGMKVKDSYEVLSGLEPSEVVVTSANFLIDSESRIRGVVHDQKNH